MRWTPRRKSASCGRRLPSSARRARPGSNPVGFRLAEELLARLDDACAADPAVELVEVTACKNPLTRRSVERDATRFEHHHDRVRLALGRTLGLAFGLALSTMLEGEVASPLIALRNHFVDCLSCYFAESPQDQIEV